ncbi:MAG TPA: hypothetical protein VLL52_22055 [Anaerolineae bacterium]|nr:hypothetical protein [Anaerolineae bacterium]
MGAAFFCWLNKQWICWDGSEFTFRTYGRDGSDLGYISRQHETWADSFSVWVYSVKHGNAPEAWWDRQNVSIEPNWQDMFYAVNSALKEVYVDN